MRRLPLAVSGLMYAAALAAGQPQEAGEGAGPPRAIVAEYDGIIHPIAAEFFDEVITHADTSGASVVVFVLRTPGGLLDSTRTIVSRMIAARTPVVVFVGPGGARAASAGFIIALAADVAVMAPGTHIGAAHPVPAAGGGGGGGSDADEKARDTMAEKAASDAAAYARTLAEARGRNVELASAAVLESRAFTENEALAASPPLIDFLAADVDEVLRLLDGRTIRRFDGRTVTLETSDADVERAEMTRRQQFLAAIAHPQIAYLLLSLGMLGLTVELWNPGAIFPGVVGGVCLLLAFFAFQILPVNAVGLTLIVFGLGLLILEVKLPSFGILGIGGIVSLLMGSLMMTSEVPGVRVSVQFLVPMVVGVGAIVLLLGRLALRAQRLRPTTGAEGLVGEVGRVLAAITPPEAGQVAVHGEIWRATSSAPLARGQRVRVTGLTGLTVQVEPVGAPAPLGDPS
ncbi:MAG: nodulation protein NfeD [Acidobacteriota bacterium]